ncbi:MAG: LysM peptidoglycan-binding domain-containing protein, partial [Chromatocurvus sp.]
ANAPAFIAVPTGGQIELQRAAQLAGVKIATLRNYNPGHLRWATAPEREEILLPAPHAMRFSEAVAGLPEDQRVTWSHYRIRSGDNLGRIARRFGTQVSLLREVNDIDGHFIRAGDTLLIPRGGDWNGSLALAKDAGVQRERAYRVRRGDSLYRIANRFNVTIDDLVNWNKIDPADYLRPGQRLTLFVNEG